MDLWKKFNPTMAFDIAIMLDFHAKTVDGIGRGYVYSPTTFILNNSTEYAAIVWGDTEPQPSFADLQTYYPVWQSVYITYPASNETIQDIYTNYMALKSHTHLIADVTSLSTALSAKADSSAVAAAYAPLSHTHAQSDITNLVSNLAAKAEGSGLLIKQLSGTTDSSSRVTVNLTNDGTSSGTALWSTSTPPLIVPLPKKGASITDPNQVMSMTEEVWSNGNKTVSLVAAKGTATTVVLAATINAEALVGSGIACDFLVVGQKA